MLWLKGHKTCKQQAVNLSPRLANHRLFILGFSHIVWSFSFITFEMKTSLPWWLRGKESACKEGDPGSIPGSGRSPGGGNGNPLQYSCPEKSHGQKSLVGYSPKGHKESDMTERLSTKSENVLSVEDAKVTPFLRCTWKRRTGGEKRVLLRLCLQGYRSFSLLLDWSLCPPAVIDMES